jgi:serine/threonine-protein kinase
VRPGELLVVPNDLDMRAVAELAPEIRARLDCAPDAVAIARPSHRGTAKIIAAGAAALLRSFAAPRTVSDAVVDFAASRDIDPLEAFDTAYPFLERMVAGGFLVTPGSGDEGPARPALARGTQLGRWTIMSCIHPMNDVEVYLVRGADESAAALKRARNESVRATRLFRNERRVLQRLRGGPAPRLLESGADQGRKYLVTTWCPGTDASTYASELRDLSPGPRRRALHDLSCSIVRAYAHLHARGIVHGDVHARNIRVDAHGRVTLIDFGWSRFLGEARTVNSLGRAGAGVAYEPEFASAVLAGRVVPPATPRGEQYLLAALLFALWTGSGYLAFALDKPRALRQVVTGRPRRFADVGVPPAPDIEAILRRALSKRPAERFGSMAAFARALERVPRPAHGSANQNLRRRMARLERASDALLTSLRVSGPDARTHVTRPPTCAVSSGAAGVAYALARLASIRSDPAALAWSDVWATRAESERNTPTAFHGDEAHLSPEHVGEISLWHAEPGVHLVRALVASGQADSTRMRAAIADYAAAAGPQKDFIDLTHGSAGLLLGCALLLEGTVPTTACDRVLVAGRRAYRSMWSAVSREPSVLAPTNRLNLGMAHGWGGILYASLRWLGLSRGRIPARVVERLDDLARCAEPYGRGVRWPWLVHGIPLATREVYAPGWCNGAAGLVHLWILAHSLLKERRYLDLAIGSAWNAWESEVDAGPHLCCGLAGQAYAMLALHRATNAHEWLLRAVILAERALASREQWNDGQGARRPESLYFGDVGLALLFAELSQPRSASMPLMEWGG